MTPEFKFRSLAAYLPSAAVFVGYFALLAVVLAPAPLTPAAISQGDKCYRCDRTIVRTRQAGEIVDRGGIAYKFRAPGCMAQYLNENPLPADRLAAIFVAENTSGLLVPVERAWFVETVVDPGTGERDFIAFNTRSWADAYAGRVGGSVVDWSAVMNEGARRAGLAMNHAD